MKIGSKLETGYKAHASNDLTCIGYYCSMLTVAGTMQGTRPVWACSRLKLERKQCLNIDYMQRDAGGHWAFTFVHATGLYVACTHRPAFYEIGFLCRYCSKLGYCGDLRRAYNSTRSDGSVAKNHARIGITIS